MIYRIIIICFVFVTQFLTAQDGPGMNPHLDKHISKLPPEKLKYLPIFLQRFDPAEMHTFTDSQIITFLNDSLNVFIADSARYYDQLMSAGQGNQLITPEILSSLKRVGHPHLSPNSKLLLYTVTTPDIRENKSHTVINLMRINEKASFPMFLTDDNMTEPNWFSDSERIAYLSNSTGKYQVFITDINQSKPKQITEMENGVANLLVSPDGKYISFTSDVKIRETVQEKYPALNKAKVMIFDKLPIRHWDTWIDENNTHLFIQPIDGGNPIDVMEYEPYDTPLKPFGGVSEIAWSPDAEEIAYTSKKVDDFALSTDSDIFIYNLKTKLTKNITKGMPGFDKDPLYSPDGKWIAFHSMERAGFESDRNRLMLYNRATGAITELSKTLDQWVGTMVWAPDSKSIYFSAEDGPVVAIYKINVADGKWEIVIKRRMNFDQGIQITSDGQYLIFGGRDMMHPTEIYYAKTNGEDFDALTYTNDHITRQLKKVDIREEWLTAVDGKKFHSWILYPPDFDSTKKYPVIVYLQGGPQATISQYFSFRWNLYTFASMGYIVMAPNRRGMPGFGQEWNDAISKDWGGLPMQDVIVATDYIRNKPYVKKDGIAGIGASAGGYQAYWLAGNHNKRFSAFLAHNGVFNVESKYGSTEELWFPNWEFGGPYWEPDNKKYYDKSSPHNFAQNWDTPIIISVGMLDFRVPYTQGLEAFTVAQVKKIPSKLLVYPEQNHWILKPQESILWFKEVFEFLDKYCKN